MRTILSLFVALLFVAGCGGSDNAETPSLMWQEGVFAPSDDFHQVCADPSKAYDQETAVQGTYVDENNWLRSFTNETYLWYDEVVDTDPACCSTPEYFELMRTLEMTSSGTPKDQFRFSVNTREYIDSQRGLDFGYGFILGRDEEGLFILHVEPDSPADKAGLRRGMLISEIDGTPTESIPDEQLISALFPSSPERHEFTVRVFGESQARPVTMTSAEIVKTPVLWEVLENRISGHRVGYMLFNEHISPAEAGLINAVRNFASEGIDEMVLDLRYNGGGLVTIASRLAFMIAGPRATENKVFDAFVHNGKLPAIDPFLFISQSTNALPLPSLDLERVFILTGLRTCSASEAIINGLRGIDVEVVLIGVTTCGKPYGSIPEDNCGTTYSLIQFRGVNDKGFGDYADGFRPTCRMGDGVLHRLGDPQEARLREAITYMLTGECSSASAQARISSGDPKAPSSSNQPESPDITEIWPPMMPLKIAD